MIEVEKKLTYHIKLSRVLVIKQQERSSILFLDSTMQQTIIINCTIMFKAQCYSIIIHLGIRNVDDFLYFLVRFIVD